MDYWGTAALGVSTVGLIGTLAYERFVLKRKELSAKTNQQKQNTVMPTATNRWGTIPVDSVTISDGELIWASVAFPKDHTVGDSEYWAALAAATPQFSQAAKKDLLIRKGLSAKTAEKRAELWHAAETAVSAHLRSEGSLHDIENNEQVSEALNALTAHPRRKKI